MSLQESGEMYLETILILSKKTMLFVRLILLSIWDIPSRLSAVLLGSFGKTS